VERSIFLFIINANGLGDDQNTHRVRANARCLSRVYKDLYNETQGGGNVLGWQAPSSNTAQKQAAKTKLKKQKNGKGLDTVANLSADLLEGANQPMSLVAGLLKGDRMPPIQKVEHLTP
jgi:hypothetical protein